MQVTNTINHTSYHNDIYIYYIHTQRLNFYFEANNVTSAETKRAIFLTVCGPSTFQLLKSLVQPNTPKEKSYTELG